MDRWVTAMWDRIDLINPNELLIGAVHENEPELVGAALSRGADPDCCDEDHRSLVFTSWPNCLKLLLDSGANVRVTDDGVSPVLDLVQSYWESDASDQQMFGPDMAECLRLLARAGADMSLPRYAWPPCFAAVLAELQDEAMDADTAQATGPSRRQGRL